MLAKYITDSDRMKLDVFLEKLDFSKIIILITFAICTILGNTLVLVATWRERSLHCLFGYRRFVGWYDFRTIGAVSTQFG
jgi:hypothetical protein